MSSSTDNSTYSPDSNSTGSSFFDAIAEKPMALVSVILVVILIAAVFVGLRSQHQAKNQAANSALFQAQKSYETELKALAAKMPPVAAPAEKGKDAAKKAAPTAATPESVQFKKIDVDGTFPESVKKYKAVADQYPGTRAAFEALLAVGSLYGDHGDPAKAATWYDQASSAAQTPTDRSDALAAYGASLEGSGKYSDAASAFQKAIDSGDSTMKGELMLSLARTQAEAGNKVNARDTYDQVIKQFPNSEQAHSAEFLKSQVK